MKTLLFIVSVVLLPWQTLFRDEMGFSEDAVWAANDISGLDMNYRQGTRAGLWGLTPEVATAFGLRVDKWVDERFDVKKSTEAAAAYLDALIQEYNNDTARALMVLVNTPYRQLGDQNWVTPGRNRHDVSKSLLDNLNAAYNIPESEKQAMIAQADSAMREERLEQRKTFEAEQKAQAKAKAAAKRPADGATNGIHKVRPGETLSHIARKYHCSVTQLMKWNNLKTDVLQIGQKLKVRK